MPIQGGLNSDLKALDPVILTIAYLLLLIIATPLSHRTTTADKRCRVRTDIQYKKYKTTQWQIAKKKPHCARTTYGETGRGTVTKSEIEFSFGDGKCTTPSLHPSLCFPCQREPLVARVCLQASGPGPWYLHTGLTGSNATSGPLFCSGVCG